MHSCREEYLTHLPLVLCVSIWRQSQGLAAPGDGKEDLEFAVFTSDGGRTWLPVCGEIRPSLTNLAEEHISLRQEMCSFVTLALVAPTAVSLFPLTAATLSVTTYLHEGGPQRVLLDDQDSVGTGINKLPAIYEVLEVQPFRLSGRDGGDGDTPQDLEAVIVISKAIPRPTEVRYAFTFIALCCASVTGCSRCPP